MLYALSFYYLGFEWFVNFKNYFYDSYLFHFVSHLEQNFNVSKLKLDSRMPRDPRIAVTLLAKGMRLIYLGSSSFSIVTPFEIQRVGSSVNYL